MRKLSVDEMKRVDAAQFKKLEKTQSSKRPR